MSNYITCRRTAAAVQVTLAETRRANDGARWWSIGVDLECDRDTELGVLGVGYHHRAKGVKRRCSWWWWVGRAEVEERDRGGGENIKIIGTSKSLGLNFIVQMALGNKTKIEPGLYREYSHCSHPLLPL